MKDLGLVSIIIPVYGVEKYLSQCLESVCGQTYRNLEIIVVDDESPDLCGKIADEFSKKDSRIKVFHINNRGAAGARNVGLDACTGDYIMFVDSDDWLELNAVETLMAILYKENCEIVQCQFKDEYVGKSDYHEYNKKCGIYGVESFLHDLIKHWEYNLIWNKIYSHQVIEDIRFIEGRCIDDEFFTYQTVLKSKKVATNNEFLYHYRQRKTSAMRNGEKEKQRLNDQVDFITQRYKHICPLFPMLKKDLLESVVTTLMLVMRNGAEYQESYNYAKNRLRQYAIKVVSDSSISNDIKKSVMVYLLKDRHTFIEKTDRIVLAQEEYFD